MHPVLSIFIVILSSIILVKSVTHFIDSASRIAFFYNLSGYSISFLLVAVSTSLPELMVGISSALAGQSTLSYANALGSNIALLTLIVGIPALLGISLNTKPIVKSQDIYYTAFFLIFVLAMALDGTITRGDGYFLLLGYLVYILAILKRGSHIQGIFAKLTDINIWKHIVVFTISLVLLLISSEGIVRATSSLSLQLGIEIGLIGLTLTAVGTSLPEIAFSIAAVRQKKQEEVMGDVIGSVVANSTLVIGVTAVIHPIIVFNHGLNTITTASALAALALFLFFSKTKGVLSKQEGLILFLLYIVFLGCSYIVS